MYSVDHPLPALRAGFAPPVGLATPSLAASDAAAADGAAPLLPPQPKNLAETGLELQLVVALVAKLIFVGGKCPLPHLTARLRLSLNVLREVLDFMVGEQLAEVAWRGASDIDVQYQLTTAGKQRAAAWLERSAYLGPAPVTLEAYRAMVQRQAWRGGAGRERIGAAALGAVLGRDGHDAGTLAQLGAALYSGRALLLHGPAGAGKSRLAGQLGQLLQGVVAVPYALLVGHEIVQLYDPQLHLAPSPLQALHARPALERRSSDIRWVLCQRPVLTVGADFDAQALAPRADPASGCHQAPPHLKANNGLFIIDDLGRQPMAPAALLERLLTPLAHGSDQLALAGGQRCPVPFDVLLVCATSLAPHTLLDPAQLRRLGYLVGIGPLGEGAYRALFAAECGAAGIVPEPALLDLLVGALHRAGGQPLLACYPRELLSRVADFAGYAGHPPRLTEAALRQAWASMHGAGPAAGAGSAP